MIFILIVLDLLNLDKSWTEKKVSESLHKAVEIRNWGFFLFALKAFIFRQEKPHVAIRNPEYSVTID